MKAIICDNTSSVLNDASATINGDTWKRTDDHTLIECDNYLNTGAYCDNIVNGCYHLGYPEMAFDSIVSSEYFNTHQQTFMVQPKFFVPGLLLV